MSDYRDSISPAEERMWRIFDAMGVIPCQMYIDHDDRVLIEVFTSFVEEFAKREAPPIQH